MKLSLRVHALPRKFGMKYLRHKSWLIFSEKEFPMQMYSVLYNIVKELLRCSKDFTCNT